MARVTVLDFSAFAPLKLATGPETWHVVNTEGTTVCADRTITHVIFDCDGVLVDSEGLSASVLMSMMAEIGLPITDDIFRTDFLGRSFANAAARVLTRFGRPMPDDFQMRYRERLLARMRESLQPMDGVFEVLDAMAVPYSLATSSSPPRLAVSLQATGLDRYFAGRCSTASEVANGKPAPDLFVLAAQRMNADPATCLVLEDSEMGILAAKAAGMQVWHFRGGVHVKRGYELPPGIAGDRAIDDMAELYRVFAAAGICSGARVAQQSQGETPRGAQT